MEKKKKLSGFLRRLVPSRGPRKVRIPEEEFRGPYAVKDGEYDDAWFWDESNDVSSPYLPNHDFTLLTIAAVSKV